MMKTILSLNAPLLSNTGNLDRTKPDVTGREGPQIGASPLGLPWQQQ